MALVAPEREDINRFFIVIFALAMLISYFSNTDSKYRACSTFCSARNVYVIMLTYIPVVR